MKNIRDRDYILDSDGNYLKVVGDVHPKGYVISYVKYFPSEFGTRIKDGKRYGYNSFVSKSFSILGGEKDRVFFTISWRDINLHSCFKDREDIFLPKETTGNNREQDNLQKT